MTLVVDTHCHVSERWYEPVEALRHHMDRSGVQHAVLVQYMGQFDNEYQFECQKRYPGYFSNVVLVDHLDGDALSRIEAYARRGAVGVRLRPDSRSPGSDPLAVWKHCEALGLRVSCSGRREEFASEAFADLVSAVPGLPIALEHLGSVNHFDGESAPFAERRKVYELSRFPNVFLKVHGLGEFSLRKRRLDDGPVFPPDTLPILDMAIEAFGPDRVMWGSDFPPVSGREGYANALALTSAEIARRGEQALRAVLGRTALRFFGLTAEALADDKGGGRSP